nr:immunoglobulin light chain junction region [Macaca mulatta]MOX48516.1 immunoglobulin light chain junction region [Macaca mulatta]MOX48542.1 immunoglobulin light chain junction region [Macaca mulatta]MOX50043.1 immunoglobulin light chain junction region [Macaca mulatta]MOX50347.1 immunoglobulin light chain junction region [Macaca mulatta]
CLQYSTTPFTF